jgi:hypothetical protein
MEQDISVFGNICWYTNLDIDTKRHEDMILYKTINEAEYPLNTIIMMQLK